MKLQYLGDSKDSFKWDYHDFLVTNLGYDLFNIALIMTPPDEGKDGKTPPSLFPARDKIIEFCQDLRSNRNIEDIKKLPKKAGSSYQVEMHNSDAYFRDRDEYFSKINSSEKQVFFLDPDNGFEPEKSLTEKHVSYQDLSNILQQLPEDSIVSVFQHFRYISFPNDYARIKERIKEHIDFGFSTAICWHSLMFVLITKSEETLNRVVAVNREYAKDKPVKILKGGLF